MSEKEGDVVKKITLFALSLLALLSVSFLMTSAYAGSKGNAKVYKNVRYLVQVEEIVDEPLVNYEGFGKVKVSYEEGQLKLRLTVNGKGSVTDGRKIIELKPSTWQWETTQNGEHLHAPKHLWLWYTRTNVTWLGNGEPLREEGLCMAFSFYPDLRSISICEMAENDWQQDYC